MARAVKDKSVYLPKEDSFIYPVTTLQLVEEMISAMFSYSSTESYSFGNKYTLRTFLNLLKKYIPELIVSTDNSLKAYSPMQARRGS